MTKHRVEKKAGKGWFIGSFLIVFLGGGFLTLGAMQPAPVELVTPDSTIQSTGHIVVGDQVSEGNFNDNARVAPGRYTKLNTPEEGKNKAIDCKRGFPVSQVDDQGNVIQKFCRVNVPHPSDGK